MTELANNPCRIPDDTAPGSIEALPYSPACQDVLDRGEHALIGVSTGNSYFTQTRLVAVFGWALRHFELVDVVYTDLHLDTMRIADGDTPQKARSRANRAITDARRRIHRAVEQLPDGAAIRVRPLSECALLPGYRDVRKRLDDALITDPRLAAACDDHVRYWMGDRPDPADEQDIARHEASLAYLLAELPLLANTPETLDVSSSLCCYHATMPVVNELRSLPEYWHPDQGHAVVRPRPDTSSQD
ncbi:tRNA-dependent cyclodipeptide synthase [Nocardia sp. NPDC051570]|uniref:tRNA-dependent cyclodipeptide synthase n=1 Tax=Nocardia sp. NPDC051570 TaxID=3364324 RepID=UPI00378D1AB8